MKSAKILYVDDESMALKYFERLVGPMATVLTALSVEEGKAMLDQHAQDIGVLVSDQRMPSAHGNELLRYARERYPSIVRMLTTAYSELGEAIEAINAGEIYRYITKPWDMESLRADLKNALELAELRSERDGLLQEKMLILQQQLLATRVSQLAVVCAGFCTQSSNDGLYTYLDGAVRAGCQPPQVDWNALDHADLMQAEARRGIAIGHELAQWQSRFGADRSPAAAAAAAAKAMPQQAQQFGNRVLLTEPRALYGVLEGAANQVPASESVAWLAWLAWFGQPVVIAAQDGGWELAPQTPPVGVLPKDWLAGCIERLWRVGQ